MSTKDQDRVRSYVNAVERGIILAGFFLVLFLPLVYINRIPGKVSETENRKLATFPKLLDEQGNLNEGIRSGMEGWLNDNIGFRQNFIEIAANIKLKIFNQSPNDKVMLGKEGWYFYTRDQNVELGTGENRLTGEQLETIAKNQQRIYNYYAQQGISYFLVLTPSKATIYPEYLSGGDYEVGESVCDQVYQYLKEHTNVPVVNTKEELLRHKDEGKKLFWKTDTHWTQWGSYWAFRSIESEMKKAGLPAADFNVETDNTTEGIGEFSNMMGVKEILGKETVPTVTWEQNAMKVEEGAFLEEVEKVNQENPESKSNPVVLYENPSAPNGTVLIYGDSQWGEIRNMPQLLGENFQRVVYTWFRNISVNLDAAVSPEAVIFSCGERYIEALLLQPPQVPEFVDTLPTLPTAPLQTSDKWIGTNGLCIDTINNQVPVNPIQLTINPAAKAVRIDGWAADFNANKPLSELYVVAGEQVLRCNYGIQRTSVSDHYGNPDLTPTGFTVTIPSSLLEKGTVDKLQFVQISADGSHQYAPVEVELLYR